MRRAVAASLIGGCLLALATAPAARAQTPPTPPTSSVTPAPSPSPTDVPQIPAKEICVGVVQPPSVDLTNPLQLNPPKYLVFGPGGPKIEDEMQACSTNGQQRAHAQAQSFMDSMVPDTSGGSVPLSSYDVGFDASLGQGPKILFGIMMEMTFAIACWEVALGLMLVTWAVEFPFAQIGSWVADELNRGLLTKVVGPLGLGWIALTICGFAVAWHLYRRRSGRAVKEVATAVIALILVGYMLTNPGALIRAEFRTASSLIQVLMTLGQPQDSASKMPPVDTSHSGLVSGFGGLSTSTAVPGTDAAMAPLKKAVLAAEVQNPYDLLNWGSPLTGRCAAIRDEALSLGPWGTASAPRDTMAKAPECQAAATFNAEPSWQRVAGAGFAMLNSTTGLILLVVLALAMLCGEFGAILAMGLAVFALLALIIPKLRSLFWRWCEAMIRVILVVIVAGFALSIWSVVMVAVNDKLPAGTALAIRFGVQGVITLVTVFAFVACIRRLPTMAKSIVKGAEKQPGWMPPKASHGGAFGLGLGSTGLGEAKAMAGKIRSLMPTDALRNKRLVRAIRSLAPEPNKELPKAPKQAPFDPTSVPYPEGPGALVPSDGPYGDGRWYSDHIHAERVPPRTDYSTTRAQIEDAQNLLSNPLRRARPAPESWSPRKHLDGVPKALPRAVIRLGPGQVPAGQVVDVEV